MRRYSITIETPLGKDSQHVLVVENDIVWIEHERGQSEKVTMSCDHECYWFATLKTTYPIPVTLELKMMFNGDFVQGTVGSFEGALTCHFTGSIVQ